MMLFWDGDMSWKRTQALKLNCWKPKLVHSGRVALAESQPLLVPGFPSLSTSLVLQGL